MHHITRRFGETLHSRSLTLPSATAGTQYPCTRSQLDAILNPPGFQIQSPPLPAPEAAQRLSQHLSQPLTSLERAACDRLQRLHTLQTPNWGPDIIQKAFFDLDTLLFGGRLRNKVCLKWETAAGIRRFCRQRGKPDHSIAVGFSTFIADEGFEGYGSARITMNADQLFFEHWEDCWREMWGTVLHEMGHAYLLVVSRSWGSDGAHGVDFRTIMRAVQRRAVPLIGVGPGR